MSSVQMLRVLVEQRMCAAAEDIFGLFERAIAQYEEQLCRTKEENERQQKLLDAVWKQKVLFHAADEQRLQEDPEPSRIKEEEEELWTNQEAPSTQVPVKSEDEEDEAQSSHLHRRQTEDGDEPQGHDPDAEECGRREPEPHVTSTDIKLTKAVKSVGKKRTRCKSKRHQCSECGKTFGFKSSLETHLRFHTGEKPFSCSECGKGFSLKSSLFAHMKGHSGDRPFGCPVCKKRFRWPCHVSKHMVTHTGERKFDCSECGTRFTSKSNLVRHMTASHGEEKPYSCNICQKPFTRNGYLQKHMKMHTETPGDT